MFLPGITTASNSRKNVIFVIDFKAIVLNEYVASVCVNDDGKLSPFSRSVPASAILDNIHFDIAAVLKIIRTSSSAIAERPRCRVG